MKTRIIVYGIIAVLILATIAFKNHRSINWDMPRDFVKSILVLSSYKQIELMDHESESTETFIYEQLLQVPGIINDFPLFTNLHLRRVSKLKTTSPLVEKAKLLIMREYSSNKIAREFAAKHISSSEKLV